MKNRGAQLTEDIGQYSETVKLMKLMMFLMIIWALNGININIQPNNMIHGETIVRLFSGKSPWEIPNTHTHMLLYHNGKIMMQSGI